MAIKRSALRQREEAEVVVCRILGETAFNPAAAREIGIGPRSVAAARRWADDHCVNNDLYNTQGGLLDGLRRRTKRSR